MASQPQHGHGLGKPWTDLEIEDLVRDLAGRGELEAADAIVWLRIELTRAKLAPRQAAKQKK